MEIKNLIDHDTFILGETPRKDELIIPVKLVLKAKQTASGKLEKLKARIVARGDMEKQRIKKTRATVQKQIQKQRQENAENNPATTKTNTIPIEIPQPIEETWSPCACSRGVKLLISTTCASFLEPISKLKSMAVILSDFHWNMHITFLNMANTL
jgi:hypothetical protein